ncbi:hypothetical protein C3747_13g444 [Trypanosoma cruzi]|uniref:Uncharacterized protein n=2 Tax=Trypanosoma cruzi TaxID=5693 RepID=Q4DR98_TRYCC|nr:hypothetical protein, conserved [Trypanosoma cruzi]EAN95055.1 hypothetical protein, conserved [Trypanosoma cruzi]PWV18412.1 hypothetical protein C3747_13g444 [Trypanosoma cruzi]RNC61700.1 hypothetical protein TcCL_ESM00551 [Trypanosoma cruzi]|eukprot:XP_816906.1 hypothetical protein [Trypanosoma cruzi strain CL Brener]
MLFRLGRHVVSRVALVALVPGGSVRLLSNSALQLAPKRRTKTSEPGKAAALGASALPTQKNDPPPRRRQRKPKGDGHDTEVLNPRGSLASLPRAKKTKGVQSVAKEIRGPTPTTSDETSESAKPSFTVDVLRVVEEWGAACANVQPEDVESGETQVENKNAASHVAVAAGTKGKPQLGATALAALLVRAVKLPEEYPTLHGVLQVYQQTPPSRSGVVVLHAIELVRNVDHLSTLVAFLRVYRTSAFSSTPVYEAVMEELVRATTMWWHQDQNSTERGERDEIVMRTTLMWILLEFRRNYFEINATSTRMADASKGNKKKVGDKRGASIEHSKWLEETTQRLLADVAVPAADHIAQEAGDRKLQTLTEGVVNMALVLLTSAMATELQMYSSHKETWERGTSQVQTAIDVYLSHNSSEDFLNASMKHLRAHGFDLLDALRLLAMLDTALSPLLRERLKRTASECFLKLCGAVGARPTLFTEVLCTPGMAQRVRALTSKDIGDYVKAAVFTGAALFCERADDAAVNQIAQQMEAVKRVSAKKEGDLCVDADEKEEDDAEVTSPRSRRATIAYGLFSAGFDPEAVLSSGLCVGHSAMEVLELLQAAALFSRSFALSPLPARLSMLLTTEVAALIEARIRAENRAGVTPTDCIEGPRPLAELLENFSPAEKNTSGKKDGLVPLEVIFHLAFGTAVELLVRGEEKKLSSQLVRLLTLLEWEGSYKYLVDGLSLLIDGFVERFRTAGRCQHDRHQQKSSMTTSTEVEQSLSEVTAFFVPRVVEAVQRRLAKTKRTSVMSDAEEQEAAQLLQLVLHFTVYVAACGMNATTAKQLVGLHTMVVKGLTSGGSDTHLASLSETVIRMNILVSYLTAKQREFGVARHPESPGLRHCSIFLNDVVAVHLKPIAAVVRRGGTIVVAQERYQVLSLVSLLFRLVSEYTVEAEPAELRAFRTDVLDPTLTRVLQEQNNGDVQCNETLDLDALSEITVVMCVPHTIHHLSSQLLDQLAAAVVVAAPKQLQLARTEDQRRYSSKTATRLLVSAAAVCQLRQDKLTARYLSLVQALGPLLLPAEVSAVLCSFVTFNVPSDSDAVVELRNRLTEEAVSTNSSLSVPETISSLQVLCELEDTTRLAHAAILRRIIYSGHRLTPGEVGILVRITTRLQQLNGTLPEDDLKFLQDLPFSLAEEVLRVRQHCSASDLPLVLQGYSQLEEDRYGELNDRVMKAYILRTIQVRPLLGPKEVVECLESYAAARVSHQYLFGVLLARVADVKLKFSLPLAVRLVRCGVNASWDKNIQTACITAAQPVFIGLVRHLLQNDPASLPSVSSNAVVVLQCLTEAFPNDPTSDLLLQNMASHHTALSLSTMMAVLELIARRSSTEYNILRCMTEHAASVLFPQTSPSAFAELTRLFVRCGVRSRVLFTALSRRFKEISNKCDGNVLATLAEAFAVAHVDLEEGIITTFLERIVALSEGKQLLLQLNHCISILKLFSHIDAEKVEQATNLLLECARKSLDTKEMVHDGVKIQQAQDINILLSASLRTAPLRHRALAKQCADALLGIVGAEGVGEEKNCGAWQTDLMLIVQLASNIVRLGLRNHPVVPYLFDALYEKRSALMRRRLLLQITAETIQIAGEHTHKQLYALLVQGKLVA